ncbi:hypothetical protein MTR62_07565 [Novosphingobium sp. 1949]|uniref:Uncharacterized protein n=1 Tax=Novosphingobium organovorum TaxID=2930092 RepID=A0ABT0BBZ0_9SPHN|nr:hypothetical protein [Novosphingobium organovorum]MCJ2182548.1 hypothetical protein [Novosphingobium organovorum]
MLPWHHKPIAKRALRLCGAALLGLAGGVTDRLFHRFHGHPPAPAQLARQLSELGLCTLDWLLLVAGMLLLVVGPGLWRQVPLPGHWASRAA